MIAYIIEGVSPMSAEKDPKMARLLSTGPWQYQPHQLGCMATWKSPSGPVPLNTFLPGRKTFDGLVYHGPKQLPQAETLMRQVAMGRMDLHTVTTSQDRGETIQIMPVYASPRQILEDNKLGGYSSAYGRAVRGLLEKLHADPTLKFSMVSDEALECCRLAIMHTYRVTKELLQDLGWLSEESWFQIWEAAIQVPKAALAKEGGN